jgi:hypothetical protein
MKAIAFTFEWDDGDGVECADPVDYVVGDSHLSDEELDNVVNYFKTGDALIDEEAEDDGIWAYAHDIVNRWSSDVEDEEMRRRFKNIRIIDID